MAQKSKPRKRAPGAGRRPFNDGMVNLPIAARISEDDIDGIMRLTPAQRGQLLAIGAAYITHCQQYPGQTIDFSKFNLSQKERKNANTD